MNNKAPKITPGLTEFDLGGIRNSSAELVNDLIVDATECVAAIIENNNVQYTATDNPLLVAVHVMAALLDYELGHLVPILERVCIALEEIAESVDFIAAQPDSDVAGDVPTDDERMVMYRALEARYLKRGKRTGQPENIEKMDAALSRFKKLAGL